MKLLLFIHVYDIILYIFFFFFFFFFFCSGKNWLLLQLLSFLWLYMVKIQVNVGGTTGPLVCKLVCKEAVVVVVFCVLLGFFFGGGGGVCLNSHI